MARPKKTVEVPGQESAPPATAAGADAGTGIDNQQQAVQQRVGDMLDATTLAARNNLLATLNEQGAGTIAKFEALGFTDLADQQLTDNLAFLQLVKKATTAAPAAPHGYVTNEEGKKQPAAGKPVLTQHGWHVPG